jgi:hypothetical protein
MKKESCFICGGGDFGQLTEAYRKCLQCGHETLVAGDAQSFMLNDPLSKDDVVRLSRLDRFKQAVLQRFDPAPPPGALWVDVGSASGKYLFQNRQRYAKVIGLEVTPGAIEFSRSVLGLEILEDAVKLPGQIHVATAWHSLEHFPVVALEYTLDALRRRIPLGGRVIVSVPNAASHQYRWFRSAYAFFDVPSHLHQFSPVSLDFLMERHGFRRQAFVTSWPYNFFGYVQSLLNVATRRHNYLYLRFKRKSAVVSRGQDILNGCLLPLALPLGWMMGVLDAVRPSQQGVITACYEKSH